MIILIPATVMSWSVSHTHFVSMSSCSSFSEVSSLTTEPPEHADRRRTAVRLGTIDYGLKHVTEALFVLLLLVVVLKNDTASIVWWIQVCIYNSISFDRQLRPADLHLKFSSSVAMV